MVFTVVGKVWLSPFAKLMSKFLAGYLTASVDLRLKFRISPGFPGRNFADFPIKCLVGFESKSGSICISTIKLPIKAKKFNGNPDFNDWFTIEISDFCGFSPPDSGQKFGHELQKVITASQRHRKICIIDLLPCLQSGGSNLLGCVGSDDFPARCSLF